MVDDKEQLINDGCVAEESRCYSASTPAGTEVSSVCLYQLEPASWTGKWPEQ
jgi:hypothetical protein